MVDYLIKLSGVGVDETVHISFICLTIYCTTESSKITGFNRRQTMLNTRNLRNNHNRQCTHGINLQVAIATWRFYRLLGLD